MRSGYCMVVLAALMVCGFNSGSAHAAEDTVRVVSFNIRYGTANDGEDRWENRDEKVVETIRDLDGDVVGLQEAFAFQMKEILEALPRYAVVGVARDDGLLEGEASPILYDRTRFTLADSGTFWLSDTPEVVGSNTWGAACTRVCTWVRLVDLETGFRFVLLNTHFDHRSRHAREQASLLIMARGAGIAGDDPFVVTGDLNAGEGSETIETMLGGEGPMKLVDTFRELHPDARGGTFTGFRVESDGGTKKIDYVLSSPGWEVIEAGIDRRKISGRYPSDHFPVWAEVGGRKK